jgi:hypothetical protein
MDGGAFQRDRDAALSRDESYGDGRGGVDVQTQQGVGTDRQYGRATGSPMQQEPYGWGYPGRGPGYGRGGGFRTETRPSFLTSEFIGTILAIVALGITAGVMDIVDARLTWILTAAMVFGYVLSRGLAKAGTASRSVDPREQLIGRAQAGGSGTQEQQSHESASSEQPTEPYGYGRSAYGYGGGGFQSRASRSPLETRPFFLTSEFVGTLLAIVAVVLTAAAMPNLGARLTWILIATMVATYAFSRGLAKAGTASHAFDPREQLLGGSNAQGAGNSQGGFASRGPIETKPFFVTSEFVGTLLAIIAIAISAATLDILNVRLTWILITAMVCGYVLSRGVAKIGVKSHSVDPREQLLRTSDGSDRQQHQPASR